MDTKFIDRNMAQEEGDIHSHNSHQSTSSTSALHNNNNQRKDSDDEAESTNTEKNISGKLLAHISGWL
ncbi:predicted protein [Lichtheimia corymbifera JMRC:FSU:9682]|uniref:Uncharacterized protein n=1 Tax=Lichtheimia corymbifera JMRC:FSU:9682 TaxID=1263082 RepID=A0A068S4G2_9FUNG|nr:predicted protein [Lichtheimia corymbifera JMRC:FSU:9682]